MLEHFSDQEIVNVIKQQRRIANYVVFGIPTKYFSSETVYYGDERYLSLAYWRELIKQAGGKILEEGSMHLENNCFKRLINYKKWFKPAAYRIFVVQ